MPSKTFFKILLAVPIFVASIVYLLSLDDSLKNDDDVWPYLVPVPNSAKNSDALRKALQAWDAVQFKNAKDCATHFNDARDNDEITKNSQLPYVIKYQILLDSPIVYSVSIETEFFCGGAHPVTVQSAINWDVETGEIIDPLLIYNIGHRTKSGIEVFPEIEEIIREKSLDAIRNNEKGDDCLEAIKNDMDNFKNLIPMAIGITSKGIYIGVQGYHVNEICYEPVIIYHEEIEKYT